MDKKRISRKRGRSTDDSLMLRLKKAGFEEYSPTEVLMDKDFITDAVMECMRNNDPEGVVEVLQIHLNAINKYKALQENDLSRATMYKAFKGKNPTVKTLCKMLSCCA